LHPRFSPDGRRVAYTRMDGWEDNRWIDGGVWVADIDGKKRVQVYKEGDDGFPEDVCWSPDGKHLACTLGNRAAKRIPQDMLFVDGVLIIDVETKESRLIDLPSAWFLGAPDWR